MPVTTGSSESYFGTILADLYGAAQKLTIHEDDRLIAKVGNYVEHKGRIWKIERVERDDDWFSDKIHLYLVGPHQEERRHRSFFQKAPWLEDEFLPGMQREYNAALEKVVFYGGRE